MKKLILSVILIFSLNVNSQPIIVDGSNVPSAGFSAPVSMATPSAGVGSAGTNQTWNFSTLSFSALGTMSVITPSTSPIGSSFPTSNYAYSFGGTYSFFKVSAGIMEVQAYSITSPGSGNDFSPNPRTTLKFPFNYLDSNADTWQKVGSSSSSVIITYDGYGTLITPTATYSNVVRVKEDYGSGAIDYQWYALNPLISILTFDHNSNKLYYTGATVVGITEQNKPNFYVNIFPNPGKGLFTLKSSSVISKIEIVNVIGENVYVTEPNSLETKIDLSNQSKGIYFYRLLTPGKIVGTGKIIIE